MLPSQADRIEAVNVKIVALILDRKKAQRHGTWAQECAINEQIDKLEKEIKAIEQE